MSRESKQAQALLRVFESLGVPLMGAVDELLAWQGAAADPNPEEAARRFSALLSASITAGTQLASRLGAPTQEEVDAVRLRVATLAASIIAQNYVLSGNLPDDALNQRLSLAFDSLLSLADSFPQLSDDVGGETDLIAARAEALTPFAMAVMRFPFGQDDQSIIRKLGERLCDHASALADAFSHGLPDDRKAYAKRELSFLKGGAQLLARACEIEMDQVQRTLGQNPNAPTPDADDVITRIWARFENGLNVLRAVIGFMSDSPVHRMTKPSSKNPAAPEKQSAKKPAGEAGSPMSFFVKKENQSAGQSTGEDAT